MIDEIARGLSRVCVWALVGLFYCSSPLLAQNTGIIAGTVIDGDLGETLIGANVVIAGTVTGSTTDLDGKYSIPGIQPGTYDLQFSYIGYNTATVQGVEVVAGETTRIDFTMTSEAVGLDEVIVEARAIQNTEAVLLRDRQKSAAVSDAISAEAISRSGSGDAAAAMTKVTGASVVDGKYVFVRGLGERYSNTTLNGSALPSSDPDRKAFQLDLFPSGLIDNIVTLKTFTPDKQGDFTGGLVDVATKDFPDDFTFSFSVSTSYNSEANLKDDFLTYLGGSDDWLGRDDGTREIPDPLQDQEVDIPEQSEGIDLFSGEATNESRLQAAQNMQRLVQSFNSVMIPTTESTPMNYGFSVAVGGPATLGKGRLGYTGSFNYGRSYSAYNDATFGEWQLVGAVEDNDFLFPDVFFSEDLGELRGREVDPLDTRFFANERGSDEASWGGSATLTYRPVPNHEIGTTFLRTQVGTQQTQVLGGLDTQSDSRAFLTNSLSYIERGLWTWQMKGEHFLRPITVEWKASLGESTQDEPDLRFLTYSANVREFERDGVAHVDTLFRYTGAQGQNPTRFFRELVEDNQSANLDISIPFKQWNGLGSKLKIGGAYGYAERTFTQRRFNYIEGDSIEFGDFDGDINAYFAQQGGFGEVVLNFGGEEIRAYPFGLYLQDVSELRDNYDADRTIAAAYAMIELPITRSLRLIGGARLETTQIELIGEEARVDEVVDPTTTDSLFIGDLDETDILPSLNLVYALRENMNFRVAATRTLARPTFRELAPFQSFNFVGGNIFRGNPQLQRTLVTNYDFRWEWFIRPGEILAASFFYKDFTDPIERVIERGTGGQGTFVTVQNVESAVVYGAEFEARKRLDNVTSAPVLRHMQLGGNLSIIESSVDIPEDEFEDILVTDPEAGDTRVLNGQSPFILNLNATYENFERGTVVSLYYNVFGERLSVVARGATPDVFERPRPDLDFNASQKIGATGITVKLGIKNILDSDFKETQEYKGLEYIYRQYERGRQFSIGLSYGI